MGSERKPKWEIGVTILKGKQAESLLEKYRDELADRLQPDEPAQFQANLAQLSVRQAGQKENLVNQKSKTERQNELIASLHTTIISVRRMVKSASPTPQLLQAFGVGFELSKSIHSVLAASDVIQTAYAKNKEWSNQAGIIDADMVEIKELQTALAVADSTQESLKFVRKAATMTKNKLQRTVEDEITKISAVGIRVFEKGNPEIAKLFEDLIPG